MMLFILPTSHFVRCDYSSCASSSARYWEFSVCLETGVTSTRNFCFLVSFCVWAVVMCHAAYWFTPVKVLPVSIKSQVTHVSSRHGPVTAFFLSCVIIGEKTLLRQDFMFFEVRVVVVNVAALVGWCRYEVGSLLSVGLNHARDFDCRVQLQLFNLLVFVSAIDISIEILCDSWPTKHAAVLYPLRTW